MRIRVRLLLNLVFVLLLAGCDSLVTFDDDTDPKVFQVYLADINGDGSLDAYVVYLNELNRVEINDGRGRFTTADRHLILGYALALGDLDGDGQLNAVLNNFDGNPNGSMCAKTPTDYSLNQTAVPGSSQPFAMRDDDNDGTAESFLVGCCKDGTDIWNYDIFTDAVPCMSQGRTNSAALADLNGDGALDAFLARGNAVDGNKEFSGEAPNEVWFNDGQGNFSDSGQRLGQAESMAVAMGDLNGDGFIDAVVGNREADEVWLNDGQGSFTNSEQQLGDELTHSLFLADLDKDGDLDLFAAGRRSGQVWINDGAGQFLEGQEIRYAPAEAVALGDVTGDGVVDLFAAGVDGYQVWRGVGNGGFNPGPVLDYQDG